MFVYMTRKHRRALDVLIREQFGADDLPRGSREALRAALDFLRGAIESSHCCCDTCTCPDRGFVKSELALADDFASLLLAAHPRWRFPLRLFA